MDRIVRHVELLRQCTAASSPALKSSRDHSVEPPTKDRIQGCVSVEEALRQIDVSHEEYPRCFDQTTDVLLLMCNDTNSDVRRVAEASLMKIFRCAIGKGNATRCQVQLYKTVKSNGSMRTVRFALHRFADLASLIRVQRARSFALSFVDVIIKLLKRAEEPLQEVLGGYLESIILILGRYFNTEETKVILKAAITNLQNEKLCVRRTAATVIAVVVQYSRKCLTFASYVLQLLMQPFHSKSSSQSSPAHLMGLFLVLYKIIPLIQSETEKKVRKCTRAGSRRDTHAVSVEQILNVYELCVYYCTATLPPNYSGVVGSAVECLAQLLRHPTDKFRVALISKGGLPSFASLPALSDAPYSSVGVARRDVLSRASSAALARSGASSLCGSVSNLADFGSSQGLEVNLMTEDVDVVPHYDAGLGDPLAAVNIPSESNDSLYNDHYSEETQVDSNAYLSKPVNLLSDSHENSDADEVGPLSPSAIKEFLISETDLMFQTDPSVGSTVKTPDDSAAEDSVALFLGDSAAVLPDEEGFHSLGDLTGVGTSSLLFCVRIIANRFLLSGSLAAEDMLVADRTARVSFKASALTCLAAAVSMYPDILLQPLFVDRPEPTLSNCLLYSEHSDQQLRSCVAHVIGEYIRCRSATASPGCDSDSDFFCSALDRLAILLVDDQNANVCRSALQSVSACFATLFRNSKLRDQTWSLFEKSLSLAERPYWLLKIDVSSFIGSLDFIDLHCIDPSLAQRAQNDCFRCLTTTLLSDSDQKVQFAAAQACTSLVDKLSPLDVREPPAKQFSFRENRDSSKIQLSEYYAQERTDPIHGLVQPLSFALAPCLSHVSRNLHLIVRRLWDRLLTADSDYVSAGVITALCEISLQYSPVQYHDAWFVQSRDCEHNLSMARLVLQLLDSSGLMFDFNAHSSCLQLTVNLVTGIYLKSVFDNTRNVDASVFIENGQLSVSLEVLKHCVKVLGAICEVISDEEKVTVPSSSLRIAGLPQPSLPSLTRRVDKTPTKTTPQSRSTFYPKEDSAVSNSSVKQKQSDAKEDIQFMKLQELLRGSYTNLLQSTDMTKTSSSVLPDSSVQRLLRLLDTTLSCLSQLFEILTIEHVGGLTEQLIPFLQACIPLVPVSALVCVRQLLKALFGANFTLLLSGGALNQRTGTPEPPLQASVGGEESMGDGLDVFNTCVVRPRTAVAKRIGGSMHQQAATDAVCNARCGWRRLRVDRFVLQRLKSGNNSSQLVNFIRLFEPVVIQALRVYTNSSKVDIQEAVLRILIQLVQVRVNYCLLDGEMKFLHNIFKQLEDESFVTAPGVEDLLSSVFELLIVLSYEKQSSNSGSAVTSDEKQCIVDSRGHVVDMSKMYQLLSVIAAHRTSYPPLLRVISVIVTDLFLIRGPARIEIPKDFNEQKDYAMKLVHTAREADLGAIDLLTPVLTHLAIEDAEKYRSLSRDVVDSVLSQLLKLEFPFVSSYMVATTSNVLRLCCPSAFRPLDLQHTGLLSVILSQPCNSNLQNPDVLNSYLCLQYIALDLLLTVANGDLIFDSLTRLQFRTVTIRPDMCQHCRDSIGSSVVCQQHPVYVEDPVALFVVHCLTVVELTCQQLLYLQTQIPRADTSVIYCVLLRYVQLFLFLLQTESLKRIAAELRTQLQHRYSWNSWIMTLQSFFPYLSLQIWSMFCVSSLSDVISSFDCSLPSISHLTTLMYLDSGEQLSSESLKRIPRDMLLSVIVQYPDESPVINLVNRCDETAVRYLVQTMCNPTASTSGTLSERQVLKTLKKFAVPCPGIVIQFLTNSYINTLHPVLQMYATEIVAQCLLCLVEHHVNTNAVLKQLEMFFLHDIDRLRFFNPLYQVYISRVGTAVESNSFEPAVLSASDILNSKQQINKSKYLQLWKVSRQQKLCQPSVLVSMLAPLTVEDVCELLSDSCDWQVILLRQCLLADGQLAQVRALAYSESCSSPVVSRESSPSKWSHSHTPKIAMRELCVVAQAAVKVMLHMIRDAVARHLTEFRDAVPAVISVMLQLDEYAQDVFGLSDADKIVQLIVDYAEYAADSSSTNSISSCVSLLNSLFANVTLTSVLQSDTNICQQVKLLKAYVTICDRVLHPCKLTVSGRYTIATDGLSEGHADVFENTTALTFEAGDKLMIWLEQGTSPSETRLIKRLKLVARSIVRLPCCLPICRTPVGAFKFGWIPRLQSVQVSSTSALTFDLPTIPVHYLLNWDILKQFNFRVCSLGWSQRSQLEDACTTLQGVLGSTPVGAAEFGKDNASEIAERVTVSAMSIRALTALLALTMRDPTPGNPQIGSPYRVERLCRGTREFYRLEAGRKLMYLCGESHRLNPCANLERETRVCQFGFGQLSIEALWGATGILAQERRLVASQQQVIVVDDSTDYTTKGDGQGEGGQPEEQVNAAPISGLPRSRSSFVVSIAASYGVDLPSLLKTMLDVYYDHWLEQGAEACSVDLLSAICESLSLLSDLFSSRDQFSWLQDRMRGIREQHGVEDEYIMCFLIVAMLKCTAVLGGGDVQTEVVEVLRKKINDPSLAVRLSVFHGALYVLQNLSDDAHTVNLLTFLCEHIYGLLNDAFVAHTDLTTCRTDRSCSDDLIRVLLSCGFYIACQHSDEKVVEFVSNFSEKCCIALLDHHVSPGVFDAVLCGLQAWMIHLPRQYAVHRSKVILAAKKLIEHKRANGTPQTGYVRVDRQLAAVDLLLTCLYATPGSALDQSDSAIDMNTSAFDIVDTLMNQTSSARPALTCKISAVLPAVIHDHLHPSDVLNRSIMQLLSPNQTHPREAALLVHNVLRDAHAKESVFAICELTVPVIACVIQRHRLSFSCWVLSCFLFSASASPWLNNLFHLACDRQGNFGQFDHDLLLCAVMGYRYQLSDSQHIDSLLATIRDSCDASVKENVVFARTCFEDAYKALMDYAQSLQSVVHPLM